MRGDRDRAAGALDRGALVDVRELLAVLVDDDDLGADRDEAAAALDADAVQVLVEARGDRDALARARAGLDDRVLADRGVGVAGHVDDEHGGADGDEAALDEPTRPKKSSASLAFTLTLPPAVTCAPSWMAATVPSGIDVSLTALEAMPVWAVKFDLAVVLCWRMRVLAGSVSLLDASESMICVQPLVPAVPEAERSASAWR